MGWPLRGRAKYREFGGSFIYPMGEDMVTLGHGRRARLPRRRAVRPRPAPGAEDAQARAQDPRRRRADRVGREDDSRGRLLLPAAQLHAPGLVLCGDGAGFVNVPALKGIHYAVEIGHARRRGDRRARFGPARRSAAPARSPSYDDAVKDSFVWSDLERVRNMRQAFAKGFVARHDARPAR